MRRGPLLLLLVAARAHGNPPAATTWADWVGDWQGKLAWKSCTVDGEPAATLPLEASDGAVAIDLSPAGAALAAMPLVEDGAGWMGQQGDVTVHLARVRDAMALEIELDSGCTIRGQLRRASTGIAACDRLEAWARIESRCTKLGRPALENPARLVRQRASWTKARGDERAKLGAQCDARSSKVETELVDAGCAPNPDPAIGLRGAECQGLRAIAARVGRCSNLPTDMRALLGREVVVLLAAAQGADAASLPVVETECKQTREKLTTVASQAGCPP